MSYFINFKLIYNWFHEVKDTRDNIFVKLN